MSTLIWRVRLSVIGHREPVGVAAALWLLAIAMVARLCVFGRKRPGSEFAEIDAYAIAEVGIVAATVGVLLFSRRLGHVFRAAGRAPFVWLFGFYVVGMASAVWSPLPSYSVFRAGEVLSQLLAVFVALSYARDFQTAERRVIFASLTVLALQVVQLLQYHAGAEALGYWRWLHSNIYSTTGAMVLAYCAGELLNGARGPRAALLWRTGGLCLGVVVLSTSSGSNIAVGVALLSACVLTRRVGVALFVALGALVLIQLVSDTGLLALFFPRKDLETIRSLHGRFTLWSMYFERLGQGNPWLGEGFAVSARINQIYNTNSHNAVVSAIMGTGVLGVALFVLGILGIALRAVRTGWGRRPGTVGVAAALIAGITNSMSKAFLGEGWDASTLVFAAFLALLCLFLEPAVRTERREAAAPEGL